ncbi:MAG: hypothetical protein U0559_09105 [Anaerolineae bacterium]
MGVKPRQQLRALDAERMRHDRLFSARRIDVDGFKLLSKLLTQLVKGERYHSWIMGNN